MDRNPKRRRLNDGPTVSCGPNFFVIGAQKAGTTRLCNLLQRHPSVAIPFKEPFYFQSPDAMKEKAQWYRSIFEDVAHLPARGDGSTSYSMCGNYSGTAQRIHEFNPDARIIYMVRQPLRRIESGWRQALVGAAVSMSGDGTDDKRIPRFRARLVQQDGAVDRADLYWKQISEYRRYFADDQIRICFFEEFIADEKTELRACLSFLGVDPIVDIEIEDDEDRNSSEGKRQRLGVVEAVRTLPGYERAKRFIPQTLKTLFTDRITRPIPTTSPWRRRACVDGIPGRRRQCCPTPACRSWSRLLAPLGRRHECSFPKGTNDARGGTGRALG